MTPVDFEKSPSKERLVASEEADRSTDPRDPESSPKQQLADRQTGQVPDLDREQQPVVAHQDRRHK